MYGTNLSEGPVSSKQDGPNTVEKYLLNDKFAEFKVELTIVIVFKDKWTNNL